MLKDKGNEGRKLSTISQKTIVKDWARIVRAPWKLHEEKCSELRGTCTGCETCQSFE